MKEGTAPILWHLALPILRDYEGDTPKVELQDSSRVIQLIQISTLEYSVEIDLTTIKKENNGQYPISFKITDEHFSDSQQATNQFASLDIKVTEKEEILEEEVEEIEEVEEEVVEEVEEVVFVPEVQIVAPPEPDAATMALIASLRADSLIGVSTMVTPKLPPGVVLLTEAA